MKKKIMLWGLITVMLFLTTGLTACIQKHKIYEDGYWQYIVIGKNTHFPQNSEDCEVAIVGLTEIGKEQTSLDVPRTIDGMDVTHIGYKNRGGGYYKLESLNLKRLYIHDNISYIEYTAFGSIWNNYRNWENGLFPFAPKIIYCGTIPFKFYDRGGLKLYIYNELFNEINVSEEMREYDWQTYDFISGNIAFMNNYSAAVNRGYFRAEDVESGEKIPEPPVPEREGYGFTGWYTETEAINLWDFDTKTEIPDGEELRLYAGWQAKR